MESSVSKAAEKPVDYATSGMNLEKQIEQCRKMMKEAAANFDFVLAAQLRDELVALEERWKKSQV
jgi:excinuclease UvrABC helicase subunit UvrB